VGSGPGVAYCHPLQSVTPTVNGISIVLGAGEPNDEVLHVLLVPTGYCASTSPSCTVHARYNLTRLQGGSDPLLMLTDGNQLIGAVIVDDLGGGAGITTGNDTGASFQPTSNTTVLSGLGYPTVGQAIDVDVLFDPRPTVSLVTISMLGRSATRSPAGFDRTRPLALALARDKDGGEQYQLNSMSAAIGPDPISLRDLTLSRSVVSGCESVVGKVTLSSPAPSGGVFVVLKDTLDAALVLMSVKMAQGATAKTFAIKTNPVAYPEAGRVGANLGGVTIVRDLSVRPIGLSAVKPSPTTVVGGHDATATATLECVAGPRLVTVDLSTSSAADASPVAPTVVVPQGLKSQTFTVAANPILSNSGAMITGEGSTTTKTRRLNVVPAATVSPTRLQFGSVAVGQTSGAMVATLRNDEVVSFAVRSISLAGSYASRYCQTNNCPANLAARASRTISVWFRPRAALTKSAKLSIAASAMSTPLTVPLSGTGT
jgi:hypothetical protein